MHRWCSPGRVALAAVKWLGPLGVVAIAVAAHGAPFLYVGEGTNPPNTLRVIDTSNDSTVALVDMPGGQVGWAALAVNPSGTRVYAISNDVVSEVDTASNFILKTNQLFRPGGAVGMALDPTGTRLYVSITTITPLGQIGALQILDAATFDTTACHDPQCIRANVRRHCCGPEQPTCLRHRKRAWRLLARM